MLLTIYQLLGQFLAERGATDALPVWQDAVLETVRLVQQERAGDAFIQALDQLLASGEVDITASRHPVDPRPSVTVVGYEDGRFVYLLPEIAYREVLLRCGRPTLAWRWVLKEQKSPKKPPI